MELLGETTDKKCLLVTCGDNNGALNWYFREHGGEWTWADVSGETNDQIAQLLGVTRQAVHKKHAKRLRALGLTTGKGSNV